MSLNLSLRNVVHHGVEGLAFVAIGASCTTLDSALGAYLAGKVVYLSAKTILDSCAPQWTQDSKRMISWTASLLTGCSVLQTALETITKQSVSFTAAMGTTLAVTGWSIAVRNLADKTVSWLTSPTIVKTTKRTEVVV